MCSSAKERERGDANKRETRGFLLFVGSGCFLANPSILFSLFRIGRSVCSLRFLSFVFSTWRKMKRINYFFEDWLFLKFQFHSFDMDKVL